MLAAMPQSHLFVALAHQNQINPAPTSINPHKPLQSVVLAPAKAEPARSMQPPRVIAACRMLESLWQMGLAE